MAAVDGDWEVTVKSPMGDQKSVLTINSNGDSFTGKMQGSLGSMDIANGSVSGNTLSAGNAYSSAMFYAVTYVLTTVGSFAMVMLLERQGHEAEQLQDFAGLAQHVHRQLADAHTIEQVF